MKLSRAAFVGCIFFLICISGTRAQPSPDSILYRESLSKIRQIYFNGIGDNAQLYHGTEFIRNGQKANGFPFYEGNDILTGSISYQGEIYPHQNFYYNLVSDELITNNYANNALIVLSIDKIDSFTVQTHVFVPLPAGKSRGLEKDGYYDKLLPGEPGLYCRREKRLVTGTGSEEAKYTQYNYYFIRLKNVFYSVEGKSELLEILKDQKDVLKKYIRSNKLNFKKDLENSLVLTTIYYSQPKH